ncbi:MAG: PKD domain-containing protein [Bacteroidetes bacterium]|nr:PKD domain-containing protein [Bacteroidota bacterium]
MQVVKKILFVVIFCFFHSINGIACTATAGSAKTICKGSSTTIGAASTTGHTYYWTCNTSGFTSTMANPTVTPTVTTKYILKDSTSTCTAKDSVIITVSAPTVNVTSGSTTFCSGLSTTLNSSVSGGFTPITYSWTSNPSGFTSTSNTGVTVSPTSTTTYTLTVKDMFTCTATDNIVITVKPAPKASFIFTKDSSCSGTPISFKDKSTGAISGTTYLWDFGNGTSTTQNPSNTYNIIGAGYLTYSVKLVVNNNNGCKDSINNNVHIAYKPDVTLLSVDSFTWCYYTSSTPNYIDTLINGSTTKSTNSNYDIDWGDGTSHYINSSFNTTNHKYTKAGFFNLTFKVTGGNGCINSKTYKEFSGSNPGNPLSSKGNTTGCIGDSVTFTLDTSATADDAPGTNYLFQFDDGSSSFSLIAPLTTNKIKHLFTKTACGITTTNYFTLSCTSSNPCGFTSNTSGSILVSEKPKSSFSLQPKDTGCLNQIIKITNTSKSGNKVYFKVSYLCDSTYDNNWLVTPSTGWSFVSSTNSTSKNPQLQFSSTGIYSIKLKIANTTKSSPICGIDSAVKQITICDKPIAKYTTIPPANMCLVKSIKFSNTTTTYCKPTYKWTCSRSSGWGFVSPSKDTSASPTLQFTDTGIFVIRLTAKNSCDTSFHDTTIIIKDKPYVSLPANKSYCGNQTLSFSSSNASHTPTYKPSRGTISAYSWTITPASGFSYTSGSSTASNPTISFTTAAGTSTTYTVILKATNECGTSAPDTQLITINPIPKTSTGSAKIICWGASTSIGGSPSASLGITPYSYNWTSTPSGYTSTVANPTVSPTITTKYFLTVTDKNGCNSND